MRGIEELWSGLPRGSRVQAAHAADRDGCGRRGLASTVSDPADIPAARVGDHSTRPSTVPSMRSFVRLLAAAALLAANLMPSFAQVTPPPMLNYEGVLTDNVTGSPVSGAIDMIFAYYTTSSGGPSDQLMKEFHTSVVAGGPVTVLNGLFNVQLGSGFMEDGEGDFSNEYTSLVAIFREFSEVWLEVQIKAPPPATTFETLLPRTRFISAPFALNSDRIDGKDSGSFLDTSSMPQTKLGSLELGSVGVSTLTVHGDLIQFEAPGANLSADEMLLQISAGDDDSDTLVMQGGNGPEDGRISIFGDNWMELRSPLFSFHNQAGTQTAALDGTGNLQIDGDLTLSGSHLVFNSATGFFDSDGGDYMFRDQNTNSILFLSDTSGVSVGGVLNVAAIQAPGAFTSTLTIGGPGLTLSLGNSANDSVVVPGSFSVTGAKNFVQNHPLRPDLSIYYTALEGDESGTYTRGTGRLIDGVARVLLGETFAWVTNPEVGLTAYLTPRGEAVPLAVESLTTAELIVRGPADAPPDLAFDYVVHGLRMGWEDFPVVQPRLHEAPVPKAGSYAISRGVDMEMDGRDALGRFRAMEAAATRTGSNGARAGDGATRHAGEAAHSDAWTAEALRQAIGEEDLSGDEVAGRDGGPVESSRDVPSSTGNAAGATRRDPPAQYEAPSPERMEAGHGVEQYLASPLRAVAPHAFEGGPILWPRSVRPTSPELAVRMAVAGEVEQGDVLVADREQPGFLRRAEIEADAGVAGVVAGDPGVLLNDRESDGVPIAFSGVTRCRVDASYGSIEVGDLLTTSPTPGHAMRADDPLPGTIIGKALEPLESGMSLIRILVMLR